MVVLLLLPGLLTGQAGTTLRVTATMRDVSGAVVPVARHALLISDNPATTEPRRVLTGTDGSVTVRLRPGSYTVESDRPYPFLGQAYQWTQMVTVAAGGETTLALTGDNAEIVAATELDSTSADSPAERDPVVRFGKWQESVVAIWSPTSRGSGFVIDAMGLIATDRRVVGQAASVAIQLSPAVKVPARVLLSDPARDVAILQVDPGVVAERAALPLACPPTAASSLDDRQEIVTLALPLRTQMDVVRGEVVELSPRAVVTDLRLSFGGAGGPAFNLDGALVGLTSVPPDDDRGRRREVNVIRSVAICEAVTVVRSGTSKTAAPEPIRLPVEPTRAFPAVSSDSRRAGTTGAATAPAPNTVAGSDPLLASSSDFDIAFITPPMVHRAQQRSDWSGGRSGRSPEAEARIGRLTEFGAWADYFAGLPAVVVVRVTPKMVEGFWKRLGREAARTQGAVLPAFKDFKGDFLRLRTSCGSTEVTPIHPFVLEHRVSDKDVVREGLYVFDPGAFGPHCGTVTLTLYSEKAPDKADTLAIDKALIDRVWQDFEPFRALGSEP